MVEMYYTEHGLPIDADKEWDYSSRYQMGKESSPLYRDVIPLNSDVLGTYIFAENLVSMQVSPPTAVTGKEEKMRAESYRESLSGRTIRYAHPHHQ